MSSNAFARTRPRVRHQRVPRALSCDHPRFLRLVNELTRLDAIKRKLGEPDEAPSGSGTSSCRPPASSNSCRAPQSAPCVAQNLPPCPVPPKQSGSGLCCGSQAAQCPNGYRSLESGQPTSSHHPSDHQGQASNHFSHHQHHSLNHHHHQHHHHHHHYHHQQQQQHQRQQQQHQHQQPQPTQQQQQHPSFTPYLQPHHPQQQDAQCMNAPHQQRLNSQPQTNCYQFKIAPSVMSASCPGVSTTFGYLKQNLPADQNSSGFSDNNPDNKQDENRTKRKRCSSDLTAIPANSRKISTSSSSKRLKSSTDEIRPLSPSFTKCPICLLDCMDRDPSFTNTCFHLFCFSCIESWTKNKATCPLCRTKFTKIIYNIKSATSYDEKTASPIRRDDDDGYITDRLMLEHLSNLNSNSNVPSNRNTSGDDMQFLFENLRSNPESLMPQYFVSQMDPRQSEPLHSFNTVTTQANFNPNVPHPPFHTNYPIASSYIALFPPNRMVTTTSAAITSAYSADPGLSTVTNDRRVSRNDRYMYPRGYDVPTSAVEPQSRAPRDAAPAMNQPVVVIDRASSSHQSHSHLHAYPHQHTHQVHNPHQGSHRTTIASSPRQSQRIEQSHRRIHLPYPIQPRHHNPGNTFTRQSYEPRQDDHQHLFETLYRQMPTYRINDADN